MGASTAIILCGGLGTRLSSVVSDRPKSMAIVAGKPFLEILITGLITQGITKLILATGYLKNEIEGYFGPEFMGAEIEYSREEAPLGTGGAIKKAAQHVTDFPVLVCNGDSWVDFTLEALAAEFRKTNSPVMLLRELEDTARFGSVSVMDGRIESFGEKSTSGPGYINAGVYLLDDSTLSRLPASVSFSFESDFLQPQISNLDFRAAFANGRFIDIGTPDDYVKAQGELS